MRLRVGYEMLYEFPQPTPIIVMLNIHHSRVSDLEKPDHILTTPSSPTSGYRDQFGNWCTRFVAPTGKVRIASDTIIFDTGKADAASPQSTQTAIQDLPEETLLFLIASRYCDSDRLMDEAWTLFGKTKPGWARVQAICEFVHKRIVFNYQHARVTRSASEAYQEQRGVCRDYAHLGIAFCRALNIPARYCTGYLGDVGTPPPYPPGDFAAWFEAYIGGKWHTFDPRNLVPRIGRVLIARGRDAADVAIATTFGPNSLKSFKVWTDEVIAPAAKAKA